MTKPSSLRSHRRDQHRRRSIVVLLAGLSMVAAACSGGDSLLDAGNESATTATEVTEPDDSTAPEGSTPATTGDDETVGDTVPDTTEPPPTTTTTPLSDLPSCPVDALEGADAVVEVEFWHGLNNENEVEMNRLTEAYNASQDRVVVTARNQGGYGATIDKYVQSSQGSRPDLVMFPEYVVQQIADSSTAIPAGACLQASGFDTSTFQPSTLSAYTTGGVQWSMPFNVSNPVLYYNRAMFRDAGLDPDAPPQSLEELRQYSQQLIDSGASTYGLAIDSGTDSGGGWFLEQWFANDGELYANNGNGRLAPATEVVYDGPAGVEMLTFVQALVQDGLAAYVGDNPGGLETFLKLADEDQPAAMTIGTSAGLGTLFNAVDGGLVPGITSDDVGIGPLPGPSGTPTALVGGASLWVVDEKGDETTSAVWNFVEYLVSAQIQSEFAVATGYVPVRSDALELEPAATKYSDDPRFRVAYDQLITSPDTPALQGVILGPQREVRVVTARAVAAIFGGADVQTSLTDAASQADALIADYAARN